LHRSVDLLRAHQKSASSPLSHAEAAFDIQPSSRTPHAKEVMKPISDEREEDRLNGAMIFNNSGYYLLLVPLSHVIWPASSGAAGAYPATPGPTIAPVGACLMKPISDEREEDRLNGAMIFNNSGYYLLEQGAYGSSCFPCLESTLPRLLTLVSVERRSRPSTFSRAFNERRCLDTNIVPHSPVSITLA
jgi:hypothetical protein